MNEWATRTRWRSGESRVTRSGSNRPRVPPVSTSAWAAPSVVSLPAQVPTPSLTYTQEDGLVVPDPVRPVGIVEQPLVTAIIDPKPDAVPSSAWVPPASWSSGAVPPPIPEVTAVPQPLVDTGAGTLYMVPPSIDQTGTTDVTEDLKAFFLTVPDGSTIRFQPNATHRCEGALFIQNRTGLSFDGNGVTITATTNGSGVPYPPEAPYELQLWFRWPRQRAHWYLYNCVNVTFNNVTVVGPNTLGGTAAGFFANYEEQCGWILHTCTNCAITNCEASYVYGDGAEVAGISLNTTISSNDFHHIGRQGIAVVRGTTVLIENNDVHYVTRSCFDLEPPAGGMVVDGVTIRGNRVGGFINVFIAALGGGDVHNVLVEDNVVDVPASNGLTVSARGYYAFRRRNWIVRRNVESAYTGSYGSPLAVMRFTYIDGVQCYENVPKPIFGSPDGRIGLDLLGRVLARPRVVRSTSTGTPSSTPDTVLSTNG